MRSRPVAVLILIVAAMMSVAVPGHAAPPSNDEAVTATDVVLGDVYNVDNTEATNGVDDPTCESSTIHRTVWFRFTPGSDMTVVARARPWMDNDVEFAAFEVVGGTTTSLGCADRYWEGHAETLRMDVSAGKAYYFMVGDSQPDIAGGPIRFDIHLPLHVQPSLDGTSWVDIGDDLTVATGRVSCSRSAPISMQAVLLRGGIAVAEGWRELACPRFRTEAWSVRLRPYDEDGTRLSPAVLQVTYFHDQDEVELTKERQVAPVRCTWIGTVRGDRFAGGARKDRLCGLYGKDHLVGGRGHDLVFGGPGADELVGNLGDDQIYGGDGDDIILGNEGRDVLFGGSGDDLLDGGPQRDRCGAGAGRDRRISCEA